MIFDLIYDNLIQLSSSDDELDLFGGNYITNSFVYSNLKYQ